MLGLIIYCFAAAYIVASYYPLILGVFDRVVLEFIWTPLLLVDPSGFYNEESIVSCNLSIMSPMFIESLCDYSPTL